MGQFEIYIWLLGIIVGVGVIGQKTSAPTPLLLVIAGMLLSLIPHFPQVKLNEELVLNFFLPLLVYESTALISWQEVKLNKRPIALLSIGHVLFITGLVAVVAHAMIPQIGWPLSFVLGAVVSPPDDVAIFAIADKILIPRRVLTVLMGEGLLNDACALTLFRFSLAAVITHEFSPLLAMSEFMVIIILETLYGYLLGHLLGQIRLRIHDPMLQIIISVLTPFLAYLPAVKLGGTGVLATVVTGLVVAHYYLERFDPSVRLLWSAVWKTIGFVTSSILFLLVGLHFYITMESISSIPTLDLALYGTVITFVVIVGRFLWVFPSAYLPRFIFRSVLKENPYPPWQYPFVISWAGMRGGISLAAALAIPALATKSTDLRALLVFIVFCVITATLLIQGLTLPWLLEKLGVNKLGLREFGDEHLSEFTARLEMADAVLKWLDDYKPKIENDTNLEEAIKLQILEYQALQNRLKDIIKNYKPDYSSRKMSKVGSTTLIFTQVIEVERVTLSKLWHEAKISHKVRDKLLEQLDLRAKRYA